MKGTLSLAGMALAIVAASCLTGCGSGSTPTADSSQASSTSQPDTAEQTRTISTSRGEVQVPANPQKIVVLGVQTAAMLESLDVDYAAVGGSFSEERQFAACYPWLVDSVFPKMRPELVAQRQINVEAVAAEKPDLIIARPYVVRDDAVYEQLMAVAPVVMPNDPAVNPDWDVTMTTVAEAVGKSELGEEIIADIKAKYTAVADANPGVQGRTYQFIGVSDDGYGMGNGSLMELLGMKPGTHQDSGHENRTTMSWEKMGDLDADLLAVFDSSKQWWPKLQSDSRFTALPAVQNGNAYETDMAVACAMNASDPIGMEWFLTNHGQEWAAKLAETAN